MQSTAKKYVNIYTEANPNPNAMKFVANYMLAPEGASFDYTDLKSAGESPLASALFTFSFVERVFITSNFITISKPAGVDWGDIKDKLKTFIKEYLEDNHPIFDIKAIVGKEEYSEGDSETVAKIKEILEEYIRPAVESDGGNITFHAYNEGVVKVKLQGSCSGCPSSTITLKAGIENLLKRMVPGVKEVVAEGV